MAPISLQIMRDEHESLSTMLRAMRQLVARGPGPDPQPFFEVLRAMLFYIDEFPERLHHPKESELLFPRVARRAPHLSAIVTRLEHDHIEGEWSVRELQHQLLGWELLGEPRRRTFVDALQRYVDFYLEHMRLEETVVLPEALKVLTAEEWREVDEAFALNCDPLTGHYPPEPAYERLFARIFETVEQTAPALND